MELKENHPLLILKELMKYLIIKNIKKFFLHYGDLTDTNSINTIIKKIIPDEIYNLAAQSHVGISLKFPSILQMSIH